MSSYDIYSIDSKQVKGYGQINAWASVSNWSDTDTKTSFTLNVSVNGTSGGAWDGPYEYGFILQAAYVLNGTQHQNDGIRTYYNGATMRSDSMNISIDKTHSAQSVDLRLDMDTYGWDMGSEYGGAPESILFNWIQVGMASISAKTNYAVTYNANGGSLGSVPSSQTKWYNEQLTLSTNQPTRTGYTFEGWATSSTSSTVSYNAGDIYSGNSKLTLYAVWKRIKYQINYDANGGTGAPSVMIKEWGIDATLSATKPTYTGYNFKNWNTKRDGTGTSYASGATYTANAGATLYAQWQEKTYIVKYDANGGSNPPAQQTKKYFTDLKLSTAKPSKDRYNFVGWSKVRNEGEAVPSDTDYHPGDLYKTNANVTLYALWTLAYIHPTVGIPTVRRCLQDGALNEEGAYIKVSFTWRVDTTIDPTNTSNDIKIEYKATDAELWKVAYTQNPGKASGTEAIVVGTGDILPNKTYEVRVIVSDAGGSKSVTSMLPQQFRTMDFGNKGRTVAFGKIATSTEGVEFGAPARFSSVHIYKDITMEESVQMKGFIIDQGNATTQDANKNTCYWRYKKYDDGTVQLWGDMTFDNFAVSTAYNGWFKATTPKFIYPFRVTDINAFPSMGSAIEGIFTASVSTVAEDGCYVVIGSPVSYNGMAHIALYMEGLVV